MAPVYKKLKEFPEKERALWRIFDRVQFEDDVVVEHGDDTKRFLDTPPKSRIEALASLMRRFGICEERGSGIDKVVPEVEMAQLPAPLFEVPEGFTRSVLFAYRPFTSMNRKDRQRACYLPA